jgi:hypothetical protein
MPYHFEVDSANKIACCRFSGRLTDKDLKECYQVASAICRVERPRAGLMDFSAVTSLKVSRAAVLELAKSSPIMPAPERIRVIIAEPLHIYGLARIFAFFGEDTRPNLHVVRSEKQAWAILGVGTPTFEPYTKSLDVNPVTVRKASF